jgi:hypothetical protein
MEQVSPAEQAANEAAAKSAALRAAINKRILETEQRAIQANPGVRRAMRRRMWLATGAPHWYVEANAFAIMAGWARDMQMRLETLDSKGGDLETPAKNLEQIREDFRMKADPQEIKRAFRSFVFRRDLSRRMREALPEGSVPDGVMSEAALAQMRGEMAETVDKFAEEISAQG